MNMIRELLDGSIPDCTRDLLAVQLYDG